MESAEGERRKHFGPGNKLWGVERTEKRASESEWSEIAFSLVKSSSERRTDGRTDGDRGGVGGARRPTPHFEHGFGVLKGRQRSLRSPPSRRKRARAHTRQGRATAEIEHADRRTTALLVPRVES